MQALQFDFAGRALSSPIGVCCVGCSLLAALSAQMFLIALAHCNKYSDITSRMYRLRPCLLLSAQVLQ